MLVEAAVEVAENPQRAAEQLAEERRDVVVPTLLARKQAAELGARVARIRPVLDAAAAAEDRVQEARDVADGVDAR